MDGISAKNVLTVLLFEPRRLAENDPSVVPQTPEIVEAMSQLLTVLRNIAARSEFVKHLVSSSFYRGKGKS